MSRPSEPRFRLTPNGSEPRTLEEPQALPLPLVRYLANATVALPRTLVLLPLRLLVGLLSPDSLTFMAAVAAVVAAADAYGRLRPALAAFQTQAEQNPGPIAASIVLGLAAATLLRGLLETFLADLLRDRLAGSGQPATAPFAARWATQTGMSLVQLSIFAGTLTAFSPLFAMSVQRLQAGGDDPKVQQITAAALTILLVVQALSQFLVGQGRSLLAWRHAFFPAAVAQMFSSPWRELRLYGKLLLWLVVGRPLFAQAGAVLLILAVQLWLTADPLRVAAAWSVVALLALVGGALSLWVDLVLLGLSGHLRGHLVWAQPRLVRAAPSTDEPLFAPPQVGWFIPEPGSAELHRFSYDQILLRPLAPLGQPAAVVEAAAPERVAAVEAVEEVASDTGSSSAAPAEVEPAEPKVAPRRLADLAATATIWRAPSGVREQRWEPPTGR